MKSMLMTLATLIAAGLLIAAHTGAGEKKDIADFIEKPGPEHKLLERLVGDYDTTAKLYMDSKEPQISKGQMKRHMIMEGRFLRETYSGEFGGLKFTGQGTTGYDQNKKKYITTWIDNFSTGIMIYQGAYDAEKKTLTNIAESIQGGKKVESKDVLRILSDDEQHFEMHQRPEGSKEYFKVMEITYKRKKDKE